MATNSAQATRLQKGDIILLEGKEDEIFKVKKISTSSPGKHGHAKVRISYENLLTGSGGETTCSGHKEIDKPVIEKERAQVISVEEGKKTKDPNKPNEPAKVRLMDLESYETYRLPVPEEVPEEELEAGVELEVRSFKSKKWIERIVPA